MVSEGEDGWYGGRGWVLGTGKGLAKGTVARKEDHAQVRGTSWRPIYALIQSTASDSTKPQDSLVTWLPFAQLQTLLRPSSARI